MNITGTLWMIHFHSPEWVEVLIGKAEDASWVKVERESDLYIECWLYLGKRVIAVVEDVILKSLTGVGT